MRSPLAERAAGPRDARLRPPRGATRAIARLSQRTLALVVVVAITAWLAVVFGTALARSNAVEQEAASVRAENAALQRQADAGRAEVDLIQTEAFLSFQARAFGMGEPEERPFALAPGEGPVSIVPLGADPGPDVPSSPLDDWLELLFR